MPVQSWLLDFASTVVNNEKVDRELENQRKYEEFQNLQQKADSNPDDYEAGIRSVLAYDQFCATQQRNQNELDALVMDTRTYLARL